MIIINEATYGEKTYIVSIGTGTAWASNYQVAAYNDQEAVDKVADYLEEKAHTGFYYDSLTVEIMAKNSHMTEEEFVQNNRLYQCGNHGIYIELLNIEEVSE